jgi:hypothetical protein
MFGVRSCSQPVEAYFLVPESMTGRTLECEEPGKSARKTQRAEYAVLAAVCALVIGVYAWSAKPGLWEMSGLNADNLYYNLLVKGFRAGHLNLDRGVPSGLAQLADPYDPDANAPYRSRDSLLDVSFYRGKLYLYFGAAPALLLFWPWYELTGHYLPHQDAVLVFCTAGFLASAGLLVALWRRYFAQVGVGVVGACLLALGLTTGTPLLLARASVCEVAISCGYALTMAALGLIFGALADPRRRPWWLAAASLAYGLAVGARPVALFGAAVLLMPLADRKSVV